MSEFAPLIISAPFGNYVHAQGTTRTRGTFTAARRGGRAAAAGRALLTVRYYRRLGAWVNRIGLRNPGIDALHHQVPGATPISESIVSVHGFEDADWTYLLDRVTEAKPLAIELNISCPNVGELTWPTQLFADAVSTGLPVIVKVPPVRYRQMASAAVAGGVRWVHAVNTLPVKSGGMSGAPLKPISLGVVSWLRDEFGTDLGIIAGGGIRTPADVRDYHDAGADRYAVGTLSMRPSAPFSDKWLDDVRAAAHGLVGEPGQGVPTPFPRDGA